MVCGKKAGPSVRGLPPPDWGCLNLGNHGVLMLLALVGTPAEVAEALVELGYETLLLGPSKGCGAG